MSCARCLVNCLALTPTIGDCRQHASGPRGASDRSARAFFFFVLFSFRLFGGSSRPSCLCVSVCASVLVYASVRVRASVRVSVFVRGAARARHQSLNQAEVLERGVRLTRTRRGGCDHPSRLKPAKPSPKPSLPPKRLEAPPMRPDLWPWEP